ncbi:MAG: hypothetical protein F4Z33_00380, partial [Gemmatimonadales bacterium]|nr:hypothetical protein [Gemmatimonadales bacterium]
MMRGPGRLLLSTTFGALVAACGQENAVPARSSVVDSAGIAIVTSDALSSDRVCRVSGEPSFAVGEVSGDERYEFYDIRGLV